MRFEEREIEGRIRKNIIYPYSPISLFHKKNPLFQKRSDNNPGNSSSRRDGNFIYELTNEKVFWSTKNEHHASLESKILSSSPTTSHSTYTIIFLMAARAVR